MAKKLGEILIDLGILTKDRLATALRVQKILGGRIGTNIVEQGLAEEEAIVKVLSIQKCIQYAKPSMLESIPKNAIKTIPPELAKKLNVIPLQIEGKKLKVAMANPEDLLAIDELSFTTGFTIEPLLALEARVAKGLEKYYGVKPTRRVVRFDTAGEAGEEKEEEVALRHAPSFKGESKTHVVDFSSIADPSLQTKKPHKEMPAIVVGELIDDKYEAITPSPEHMEEPLESTLLERQNLLAETSLKLSRVETRDEIGNALLDYFGSYFERAALFILQSNLTIGWKGTGKFIRPELVKSVRIPSSMPSIFDTLRENKTYFLGSMPPAKGNELLMAALSSAPPPSVILLPVIFRDAVVSAVYGDNGNKQFEKVDLHSFRRITRKASQAMEMLLLKSKIRMDEE